MARRIKDERMSAAKEIRSKLMEIATLIEERIHPLLSQMRSRHRGQGEFVGQRFLPGVSVFREVAEVLCCSWRGGGGAGGSWLGGPGGQVGGARD